MSNEEKPLVEIVGLDKSTYNGQVNYRKAKAAGARYAYSRSTIGDHYIDNLFEEDYASAKAEAMPWGPYHVVTPDRSVNGQLDLLYKALDGKSFELPVALDCELHNRQKASVITAVIWKMAVQIEKDLGRVILYTAAGFWNYYVLASKEWQRFPLWVANYTTASRPLLPRDWTDYWIWQYSADGNMLGPTYGAKSKSIDLNRFNGNEAAFREFIGGKVPAPVPDDLTALRAGFYLRNQPEQNEKTAIATTSNGARAKVIGESGEWRQVETWIHKSALQ